MIHWTDSARRALEEYCQRTRDNLRGTGADVEEVVEDLKRHIDEEIRQAGLSTVTEEDLRRLLGRFGEPVIPHEARPSSLRWWQRVFFFLAFVLGVLLPLGTLGFEMYTGISAAVLFDPIPTWFHVAAIALVPVINLWLGRIAITGRCRHPRLAGWLAGAAAGIGFYYSLLYVPFTPIACVAVIYFGIGLVPLAPYLALLFTLLLYRKAGRQLGGCRLTGFGLAFGIIFGALILAQVPASLTYYGLARAVSDEPAVKGEGIALLRFCGDRETLLRHCYESDRNSSDWDFDLIHWLASRNIRVSTDQAREIYFRVTGKPFNSVPPPALYTRLGRWEGVEDEFTWDEALGGETVAGRVKGLSLQSSRMDAVAEPDAATVYCEWTMEFKNVSSLEREARAQISLPPGAVVSRLTLWVNGEEREAAFSGRSHVREAYQQVAVTQRHDPVLVTTCGPDRILLQCFPVPPNGGTMKVRFGITAPLALESRARGRFTWPELQERNFKLAPELKHALWIESPLKLTPLNSSMTVEQTPQRCGLRGSIPDDALAGVLVDRSPDVSETWTPALESNQVIRQHIEDVVPPPASKIVFVIDGSAGMASAKQAVAKALATVPPPMATAMVIAGDMPFTPDPVADNDQAAVSLLEHFRFRGGRDDVPALETGWDLAAASDHGVVIWIHDTQPVLLSSADSLRQRFEHSVKNVTVYDYQVQPGPDRIAEKLDGLNAFVPAPRYTGAITDDLTDLLATAEGKVHRLELVRDRVDGDHAPGRQASRHIERLWARDEADRLAEARRFTDASKLAAEHQLVTPFSGAVVLQTQQQYAQNNLNPGDPTIIPAVPEPGTWALLAFGAGLGLWRRHRHRK